MPIEIPIPFDVPLFSQRITIDGIEYIFQFDWHEREKRWYVSLFDIEGKPLVTGTKIVANWPLFRIRTTTGLPKGMLMPVDFSPQNGEPPTYYELGTRVRLIYYPNG